MSVAGAMEWLSWSDLSPELLYEVLRFRQDIFVVEQHCAYSELDGRDQVGRHLLLRIGGTVAGYLRLIPDAGNKQVRIGRVAVAAAHRRRGLARRLMAEALAALPRRLPGLCLRPERAGASRTVLRRFRLHPGVVALRRRGHSARRYG